MVKAPAFLLAQRFFASLLCLVSINCLCAAEDVTISAFLKNGDQYGLVTGEIVGTNAVTLFFSASVQDFGSGLKIEAPLMSAAAYGSAGGASIEVFDSGPVTVTYLKDGLPGTSTNFFVKVVDPLILAVALMDRVGSRIVTGTNSTMNAVDYAYATLSSRFPAGPIYYTTDGTEPNVLSRRYTGLTGSLNFTTDTDLWVVAYSADFAQSQQRRVHIHIIPGVYLRIINPDGASVQVLDRPDAPNAGFIFVSSNSVVRLQHTNSPEGAEFLGWRGFTNSTNALIEFALNRNREILQAFNFTNHGTVQIQVSGSGKVIAGETLRSEKFPLISSSGSATPGFYQQFTAVADPGHFFAGWANSSAPVSYPQSLTFGTVQALFAPLPQDYHSLTLEGSGLINFSPLEHYAFTNGAEVTVTASGGPGFMFTHWSGDASGSNVTIRIKMDADKHLIAHSEPITAWRSYSSTFSPASVGDSGLIYSSGYGYLRAFDRVGIVDWEIPFPSPSDQPFAELSYPVVGPGERIYVGTPDSTLAFDRTGRMLWKAPTGAQRLALSTNGIYALGKAGELVHLSFSGAILDKINNVAWFRAFALTPEGNVLVSGYTNADSYLLCLSPSLVERWRHHPDPEGVVVRTDGTILTTGWTNELLDRAGNLIWTKTNSGNSALYSVCTALSTNRFFLTDRDDQGRFQLSALDNNGATVWTRPIENFGSVVALEDGSIVSAVVTANVVAFRRVDSVGTVIGQTSLDWSTAPVNVQPPWPQPNLVLGPNGDLYLINGSLTKLDLGLKPADSGWSMWFGDWRNTGQPLPANNVASELGLFIEANPDFVQVTVSAPPNTTWELQSSTDLVNWSKLPATTAPVEIPTIAAGQKQFFRVLKR